MLYLQPTAFTPRGTFLTQHLSEVLDLTHSEDYETNYQSSLIEFSVEVCNK